MQSLYNGGAEKSLINLLNERIGFETVGMLCCKKRKENVWKTKILYAK